MTQDTNSELSIEITSVPDRDDLVAEIWKGGDMLGELRHEDGGLRVQIYPAPSGPWDVGYDDLVAVLSQAREKLGPPA